MFHSAVNSSKLQRVPNPALTDDRQMDRTDEFLSSGGLHLMGLIVCTQLKFSK